MDKDDSPILGLECTVAKGKPVRLQAPSPQADYAVVFEDDGTSAYLYALDNRAPTATVLDSLHIYTVALVPESLPQLLQIVWSHDGQKVALFIDNYPHASFDFGVHRGYCRSNYPPPDKTYTQFSHEWSDTAIEWLADA